MEKQRKKGSGGARKGAGRPKGDSRIFSFRCPGPLADRLEVRPDKTAFIRDCVAMGVAGEGFGTVKPEPFDIIAASVVTPVHLPYFDVRVRAGFPVPLDNDERAQDVELLKMLCPHPEATYLIRIIGDSMRDAGVRSGDIVIVDKSRREPLPKEMAVCELNGEYTLKHFERDDAGQGWLVPDNPDYPRIPVGVGDDFSIWGTVTYIIHRAV